MPSIGLAGPNYQSQSPAAIAALTMNWYPEAIEVQSGKAPIVLYPTPGMKRFAYINGETLAIRGEYSINGRVFVVGSIGDPGAGGINFFELLSNGTMNGINIVDNDNLPVTMCSNGQQLLICSAGKMYVYNLVGPGFNWVEFDSAGDPMMPITSVGFLDNFFIALQSDARTFQISQLADALTWDPIDVAQISVFGDNIVSMFVDHRELWFLGITKTVVYYNSGDADFPFVPLAGGFIEQGSVAKDAVAKLDNTIMWLGGDERGAGIVWRAKGYVPERVSDHALEFAIQGYMRDETGVYDVARISNAVAYSYQDQGHAFYVLFFPTPSKTWVYDAATGKWHQRGYWDTNGAYFTADRGQCHVFAFGKHLVGDWQDGNIFETSIFYYDIAGTAIRRVRRAPYISPMSAKPGDGYDYFAALLLDFETGLGIEVPLWDATVTYTSRQGVNYAGKNWVSAIDGNINNAPDAVGSLYWVEGDPAGYDPQVTLRISRDGGKTWGNEMTQSAGKLGEWSKRVIFRRLGRALKGRAVFEVTVSDPIAWRLVGDDLVLGG